MLGARVIYDVVCELIGDIEPEGDAVYDRKRRMGLVIETELVNMLLEDIEKVASMNMTEGSAQGIIMTAREAVKNWANRLTERSEEL